MKKVNALQLKDMLNEHQEFALIDIREHGQYGESHLFFAVSIPYSLLECRFRELVPNFKTPIVLYANAVQDHLLQQAGANLKALGYGDISYLDGGIDAWQAAGFNTFAGVNLPSKTFGELAEIEYQTPHLSAHELNKLINDPAKKLLILDGRPIEEYRKMNIPGAACCPNGELALRAAQMVGDEETTIVINCAGRTRSIIGAQSLINFGLKNPIYALENGTQGWYLEDFQLEHGSDRLYPEHIDETLQLALQEKGQALKQRFELSDITLSEFADLLKAEQSTTYLCDIRTKNEFTASQWPQIVRHTPGGQLIQATDEFIGVRNATIVLIDTDGIRAPLVASWLKQLSWTVYLLPAAEAAPDKLAELLPECHGFELPLKHCTQLSAEQLDDVISAQADLLIIDTRNSMDFRKRRLQNSHWLNRAHLLNQSASAQTILNAPKSTPILLLGDKPSRNSLLAADLEQLGFKHLYVSEVDASFFEKTTHALSKDATMLSNEDCIDYLFFVHDRHHGNKAAAIQYLKWETDLISQIDEHERNTFNFKYAGAAGNEV
ncbi:MAG: rhodanese-like domain-containing protein [Alcaligenaceae bacterium]|nr:rhodanese-like domain-containing protein [Alcaligenaceae bacterium]